MTAPNSDDDRSILVRQRIAAAFHKLAEVACDLYRELAALNHPEARRALVGIRVVAQEAQNARRAWHEHATKSKTV